jgi:hypothetical protein
MPASPFAIYVSSTDGNAADTNGGWPYETANPTAYARLVITSIAVTAGATTITIPNAKKAGLNPATLGYTVNTVDGVANAGAMLCISGAGVAATDRRRFRITNASGLTGAGDATLTISHALTSSATVDVTIGGPLATIGSNASLTLFAKGAGNGDLHQTGWLVRVCDAHAETAPNIPLRASGDTTNGPVGIVADHALRRASRAGMARRPIFYANVGATANFLDDAATNASNDFHISGIDIVAVDNTSASLKGSAIRAQSRMTIRDVSIRSTSTGGRWTNGLFLSGGRATTVAGCTIRDCNGIGLYLASGLGTRVVNCTIINPSITASSIGLQIASSNSQEHAIIGNRIAGWATGVKHDGFQAGSAYSVGPDTFANNTVARCTLGWQFTTSEASTGFFGAMIFTGNLFVGCTNDLDFSTAAVTADFLRRMGVNFSHNATSNPTSSLATTWDAQVGGATGQDVLPYLLSEVSGISNDGAFVPGTLATAGLGGTGIGSAAGTASGERNQR